MSAAFRGIYAIVDPGAGGGRPALELADAILAGGCGALQLRVKDAIADRALLELARTVAARCRSAGVPFVVNDRPDIARLSDADGLHLGQEDLPIEDARRIVGSMHIGISTHDLGQARDAQARGADLIGFGPVFPTRSKVRPDPLVGLEGLRAVCGAVDVPVVGIGGITIERTGEVRRAGAAMAAVIGALCGADEPEAAARAMTAAWTGAG